MGGIGVQIALHAEHLEWTTISDGDESAHLDGDIGYKPQAGDHLAKAFVILCQAAATRHGVTPGGGWRSAVTDEPISIRPFFPRLCPHLLHHPPAAVLEGAVSAAGPPQTAVDGRERWSLALPRSRPTPHHHANGRSRAQSSVLTRCR